MLISRKTAAAWIAFAWGIFVIGIILFTLGYLHRLWNKTDRGEITPVFELPEKGKAPTGKGSSKSRRD